MLTQLNGIILKSLIYMGALHDIVEKGHTTKVVIEHLQNYLNHRHSIHLHNFYNSFELASKLINCNTYCTWTLTSKRTNIPKKLLAKKLNRGQSAVVYCSYRMIGRLARRETKVTYIFQMTMKMIFLNV